MGDSGKMTAERETRGCAQSLCKQRPYDRESEGGPTASSPMSLNVGGLDNESLRISQRLWLCGVSPS